MLFKKSQKNSLSYEGITENSLTELSNGKGTKKEEKAYSKRNKKSKVAAAASFSNSSLVNHVRISPNKNVNRTHAIDTITIHCVVGQCTVEALGELFANPGRQASSNYGIGYDGRIGLYVDEKDRSWCSASPSNDHRAITIEVASDTFAPYAVKQAAYDSLIKLVADICKRNNITKLIWSNNASDRINHKNGCNMTCHKDFESTMCPGQYLYEREADIAAKVNAIIEKKPEPTPAPTPVPTNTIKVGDIVKLKAGANQDVYGTYLATDYLAKQELIVKRITNKEVYLYNKQKGWLECIMDISNIEKIKDNTIKVGDIVKVITNYDIYGTHLAVDYLNKQTLEVFSINNGNVFIKNKKQG